MIRRFAAVAFVLLLTAAASPGAARAQSAGTPPSRVDSSLAATGGIVGAAADSALLDLGRAVAVLAQTVQQTVVETANKPEVRLAAVQAAGQAVSIAQKALTENVSDIERLLAEATKALAALEATQKARVSTP